ncbi:ankyrin [Aspergillus ellipticus CBS 707.79]|uniref:Ankyrin n=1 Tax=Aspergillus ellipticus CBS 707.79 TaxID=1448320 RepID=A0A319DQT1_9EURO|nr:ankyrin [Aspergillus ellipticus CBS 707.79]
MAGAEWELYKPEIVRLYVEENKPLPEVIERMKSMYAFDKKRGQYERKLKKWGCLKYDTRSSDDWKAISKIIEKGKREGKENEVYLNGYECAPAKIRRKTYNKAFVSTVEMFARDCYAQDKVKYLSSIVPWSSISQPPNIDSGSRITAALSILMPEEYEGQHRGLPPKVCNSPTVSNSPRIVYLKPSPVDLVSLNIFLVSNNLSLHSLSGSNGRRIMEIFRENGGKSVGHLKSLLSTSEPTAGATVEKLFAGALRLIDTDVVRMMLDAGMDPNQPINTSYGILAPLQYAATIRKNTKLLTLLLAHGSDVNLSIKGNTALYHAIRHENKQAVLIPLCHGAIVTPSCLAFAVRQRFSLDIISNLIDVCHNVNTRNRLRDYSALAEAIAHENVAAMHLLLGKGAEVNAFVEINFEGVIAETTILGLGTQSKNMEIVEPLLRSCININPEIDGLLYVSPLVIAVKNGQRCSIGEHLWKERLSTVGSTCLLCFTMKELQSLVMANGSIAELWSLRRATDLLLLQGF